VSITVEYKNNTPRAAATAAAAATYTRPRYPVVQGVCVRAFGSSAVAVTAHRADDSYGRVTYTCHIPLAADGIERPRGTAAAFRPCRLFFLILCAIFPDTRVDKSITGRDPVFRCLRLGPRFSTFRRPSVVHVVVFNGRRRLNNDNDFS